MEDITVQINGPPQIFLTQYTGKKFIFIGDFHLPPGWPYSKEIGAECKACATDNCINTINLLSLIFTEAEKKNKGVELYAEIPFRKTYKTGVTEFGQGAESLTELVNFFDICFAKRATCPFPNVLFQYTDIRTEIVDLTAGEYLKQKEKNFLGGYGGKFFANLFEYDQMYNRNSLGYEIYLLQKIIRTVENIKSGNSVKNSKLKKIVNQIFIEQVNRENVAYRLYYLYFTSNDVENDVLKLFSDINIKNKKELLLPASMIVKREGRTIHRIKSQIEALEHENKEALAKKIITFVLNKYKSYLYYQIVPNITDIVNSLEIISNQKKTANYDTYYENLDVAIQKMTWEMLMNYALIMDAYTLPRLFRTFTVPLTKIKPSKKIVYAGAFHLRNYVEFFETVLGVKVAKYDNNPNYNKCTNINVKDYLWMIE